MNNLDRFMEFVVAAVFVCVGIRNIYSYRRRPKPLGARHAELPFRLPYAVIAAVGLFEILAALALVAPVGPLPQATVVKLAALGLSLMAVAYGIYQIKRQETPTPAVVLFLLTLFVLVGRTI